MEYYLSHQNRDGSWGDTNEKDIYMRYHPTWNAIAGLSEYAWDREGLSFPEVKPLLEKWARGESSGMLKGSPQRAIYYLRVGSTLRGRLFLSDFHQ
jgi:hypothetical protein